MRVSSFSLQAATRPPMASVSKLQSLPKKTQEAIVTRILVGEVAKNAIARQYQTSGSSVARLVETFTEDEQAMLIAKWMEGKQVAEAKAAQESVTLFGEDVATDMRWVLGKLKKLIEDTDDTDDTYTFLMALKETRQALMSLAEVQGKLAKRIEIDVDVKNSPAFHDLKMVVMKVLENHPAAKADFLAELHGMKLINATPSSE